MNRAEPLTYSVDEVAELLGIARGVAYECVRNGSIPATRVGRRWLVPRKRSMRGWTARRRPRRTDEGVADRASLSRPQVPNHAYFRDLAGNRRVKTFPTKRDAHVPR